MKVDVVTFIMDIYTLLFLAVVNAVLLPFLFSLFTLLNPR